MKKETTDGGALLNSSQFSALSGDPKNVRKHFAAEKSPYLLHNEQPIHVHGFPAFQISRSPLTPYQALPLFYSSDKVIISSIATRLIDR
jgi:hypothetical protein